MVEAGTGALLQKPGVRQFVKFCIVGASSFAIDVGIAYLLHYHLFKLPLLFANVISFCLAVTNGFFWNQRWTFRAVGQRKHHEQYVMFFGVNLIGLALNAGIVLFIAYSATGVWNPRETPRPVFLIAKVAA